MSRKRIPIGAKYLHLHHRNHSYSNRHWSSKSHPPKGSSHLHEQNKNTRFMENALKKLFAALLLCLVQSAVCTADTFKGKIVNAETGEILIGATVQSEINPQPGWSILNSAETDSTGCFKLDTSREGRIMFTFSMIGYKNSRKVDYAYGSEVNDTTDLGTIRLQPTALMLQEVEVTAKVPRITMRGDTIVFNPEAFKLKEGARLDELIKKLPGVERRDGKLFWNDKPIRLMMNGKDMFGGDQILGQLPADVADKLKVYDRKSELARHTGKDEGEEDHVLDIQVKPGFLDKWYGDIAAQYQTKKRYSAALTASRLSDHDPQMVYAQANNTNRYVDKTIGSTMNRNIDGDGKSQYGSYNYQHNWQTKGTQQYTGNSFNISANMGHSDGWNTGGQSTETFFPNKEHTFAIKDSYRYKHNLKPQMEAKLFAYADSINTIDVKVKATYEKARKSYEEMSASYGYQPDQFAYHSLNEALAAKPGDALYDRLITRNRNYESSEQQKRGLNISYEWQHFIGKKGSFTLQGYTNLSGTDEDTHTNRNVGYLREQRNETLWQYYDRSDHDMETLLGASLEHWLGKKVYFNIYDNVSYQRTRIARDFFSDTDERNVANGTPTTADPANTMRNLTHKWKNELAVKSTITPVKALMIMPKFRWNINHEKTDYLYGTLDTTAVRTSHSYEPSIFLKWKMSRVRNMDIAFAYNTSVPELVSTLGYRNTIDPLQIYTGNPLLRNSHSHTTTYNYHRMWLRKQIVLGVSASYNKDINPVATLYSYNSATGVYESKPTNVKGGDTWKVGLNYDQGIGFYFRLMNKFALETAKSYGFLTIVDNNAADAQPELNKQKRLGIDNNFELSYETEKLQLSLFDRLEWNRYRYNDTSYNTSPLFNSVGVSANLKIASFEFFVQLSDDYRSGYATSAMNGHKLMSMASVSYSFCKNKCRLRLFADDIFNKDIWYGSNYSAYQRQEYSANYIHHYLNLSFTYRFDAKTKDKKTTTIVTGK